jgi:hypothetical protein
MNDFLKKIVEKTPQIILVIIILVIYFVFKQNLLLKEIQSNLKDNLNFFREQQLKEKEELKNQLALLREELIRYKAQQEGRDQMLSSILGQNQKPINNQENYLKEIEQLTSTLSANIDIKGIVKLKKNWQQAEVYETNRASAKILGKIVQGKLYFVYDKAPNWYKIEYENGQWGWVQTSLVEEL